MALCCDAELQDDGTVKGEPTEAALVAYADKLGLKKTNLKILSQESVKHRLIQAER